MSNLKKIVLVSILILMIITGIGNISIANDEYASTRELTGKTETINDTEYYYNKRMFCIESYAWNPAGEYERIAHIKIDGKTVENMDTNKIWKSNGNPLEENFANESAKLAFMLCNNPSKKVPDVTRRDADKCRIIDETSTLRAIGWLFFPNWWNGDNGANKRLGINSDITVEGKKGINNQTALDGYNNLLTRAGTYADSYNGAELTKNNENKDVKAQKVTYNNKSYYKIGPFNCTFSNPLDNISVNTDKGDISPKLYEQSSKVFSEISNIKSGVGNGNFYVYIDGDNEITKINKVTINGAEVRTYIAELFIYTAVSIPTDQNFAYYKPDYRDAKPHIEYTLNLSIDGELKIQKIDTSGKGRVNGLGFKVYSNVKKGWLQINSDNKINYVTFDEATPLITKTIGGISGITDTIKNMPVGKYSIYETNLGPYSDLYTLPMASVPGEKVQKRAKEIIKDYEVYGSSSLPVKAYNTPEYGSLQIKKIDEDTQETLPGIGFKIYSKAKQQWLLLSSNNELTFYTSFSNATEVKTKTDGLTDIITKLPEGEYDIYETSLGNYINTYKLDEMSVPGESQKYAAKFIETKNVEANGASDPAISIGENKKAFIKLSGYVWKDIQSQKQSVRNSLFKDNNDDDKDELLEGIVVRLKYKGNTVDTKTTNSQGKYVFENVEIDKLADYSIEFEYSGLTYSNVIPHTNIDNGSKATEGNARTTFNNKFTEITYDTKIDGTTLEYSFEKPDDEKARSTLTNGDKFVITSTTSEAGLNIKDKYETGMTEIEDLNLGLYEREQPDLEVVKDLDNVMMTVNGYGHIYEYALKLNPEKYTDGFNVGVRFEVGGPRTYSRAIYKADYDFSPEDKSNELKAYITYKIEVINHAVELTSKVNSLIDYYDSRYTLVAAGTEFNTRNGNITGTTISYTEDSYNKDYKKAILDTNMTIDAQDAKFIYVQFSLSKEAIGSILFDANGEEVTDKILLNNVAEINSYTTYKDNVLYAGVDSHSRPGNATPGDNVNYEYDTDAAPALVLELSDARKITGTVFEDSVTGEIKAGEERLGDGIYTDGEKTIQGVTVSLVKEDGSIEKTAITDENGNFEFSGFMPGNYTIVYTWGDETYTVDDYKGTIYKDLERFGRRLWYNENVDTRYSDAIDDYDTRKLIDSGNHPEITTMDSSTQAMKLGIEVSDQNTGRVLDITPGIDKVEFLIKNVDFGIVERPRQKLDISKEVTAIKTTVGEIELVNVRKEDGSFVPVANGSTINIKNFIVTPPDKDSQKSKVKEELDSDLLNNATVEIEYTITVANNSELDYDSERYYKYGIKDGNKVVVKPVGVYDYLDKEMALNPDKADENAKWTKVEPTVYTNTITNNPTILDEYLIPYGSTYFDEMGNKIEISGFKSCVEEYLGETIEEWTTPVLTTFRQKMVADKTILHNEELEGELEAGDKKEVKLYTSTKLSASGEIDLNNSAEITKVERNTTTGRKVTPRTSKLFDSGEQVVVTPPTGENHDYVLPIALGVSVLVILGAGVILIKKKVLNK